MKIKHIYYSRKEGCTQSLGIKYNKNNNNKTNKLNKNI